MLCKWQLGTEKEQFHIFLMENSKGNPTEEFHFKIRLSTQLNRAGSSVMNILIQSLAPAIYRHLENEPAGGSCFSASSMNEWVDEHISQLENVSFLEAINKITQILDIRSSQILEAELSDRSRNPCS